LLEKVRQQRHKLIVLTLIGTVLGSLAGLTYIAIRIPAYSASAELLISNTTLQLSGPEAVVTQVLLENSLIESAMALLTSGRVLERVINKLGLEEVQRISPKKYALPWVDFHSQAETPDARRQDTIALLRDNTTVKRVGASQIVSVRARAVSATDAARLTNEIAGAFVKDQYDSNAVVTTNAALRERIKVLGPTARLISDAAPPDYKDPPSAKLAMLLAIVVGSILGAAGGVALILFDRRLRAAEQLESLTSAECFGCAPLINRQSSEPGRLSEPLLSRGQFGPHRASANGSGRGVLHKISLLKDLPRKIPLLQHLLPEDPCYDVDLHSICRRLLLRRARSTLLERSTSVPRIVGVTSCHAREGKTTIANMLAHFLTNDDASVLLIDASSDLASDPTHAKPSGLHELLRGNVALEDVVLDNIHPNLDFLPTGQDLGELDLLWTNLVQAVNDSPRRYEWIILDLPPLTRPIDVRSAGQILDQLIIVVEWGGASEAELSRGLRALGSFGEKIAGTIINKAPWTLIDSDIAGPNQTGGSIQTVVDPKFSTMRHSYDQEKIQ
jgi:Mrp family chromosome partitioning ATPase/capsular polysaccharide biosynthesis protein